MRYVKILRADAVTLAKLEQRSLLQRATGPCAFRWYAAAREAAAIAAALRATRDAEVTQRMHAVARAWDRAFKCERTAKKNNVSR